MHHRCYKMLTRSQAWRPRLNITVRLLVKTMCMSAQTTMLSQWIIGFAIWESDALMVPFTVAVGSQCVRYLAPDRTKRCRRTLVHARSTQTFYWLISAVRQKRLGLPRGTSNIGPASIIHKQKYSYRHLVDNRTERKHNQ